MPAQLFGLWLVPLIPPAKHGGRKRKVDVREVVNGIMYVLSTGCQWRTNAITAPPNRKRPQGILVRDLILGIAPRRRLPPA
jgi:transposase